MSRYRRSRRALPSSLHTLVYSLAAVTVLAACVLVAAVWIWILDHLWALLLVGMAVAAVVAVRAARQAMRRQAMHGKTKLNVPAMSPGVLEPRTVPRYGRRSQPLRPPRLPRPPRPPRPATSPGQRASQVVYWGKQRVGTLDEQGTFRPDR